MKKVLLGNIILTMLVGCGSDETSVDEKIAAENQHKDTLDIAEDTATVVMKNPKTIIVWENAGKVDFSADFPLGKFKEYDADGKLLLEGEQVEFNACVMNAGIWKYYDHYEVIYREVSYHLYCGEESTCHDTQIDLDIVEYYPNGNLKAKKYIHSCYECVQFKTGAWTYYNSQGDLDSTIVYDEMVECKDEEMY